MTHDTFTWRAADGQPLHGQAWQGRGAARAVVCLVHGLGEHAGRYGHVADALAQRSFATLAIDLRGHGRTPGPRGHAPSFDVLMFDIDLLLAQAEQLLPGRPRFLYGHSMGGSLVLNYALRREPKIAGVVATSPGLQTFRPVPAPKRLLGRILRRLWPSCRMSNGLDRTGLSRDTEVVRRYLEDPLVHDRVSAQCGVDLLDAGAWAIAHAREFRLPLLLVHGTSDRVTAIASTREFAGRVPADCTLREWPGLYHETHNEPEWREVLDFTITWMEERIAPRA